MKIALDSVDAGARYRLLAGTITPRPIAWISTRNPDSGTNLAPYSFFNVIGTTPPLLAFSTNRRSTGEPKDTCSNILRTGEFVVNLVSKPQAEAMNFSAAPFPPGVSEAARTGIAICPADSISVHRLEEAPASFECHLWKAVELSEEMTLIIGKIIVMHIMDAALASMEPLRICNERLQLVGRMHGNRYIDTQNSYAMAPATLD